MDYDPTPVRDLSAEIFGGAGYRLEIWAALRSGEQFSQTDLAVLLGDPPGKGSISAEVNKLKRAGLVTELKRPAGDRHRYYLPRSCSVWDAAREIVALARPAPARPSARQGRRTT